MKDGRYAPDFDWPRIANSYFPSKNLGPVLSLAVIDTDLVAISIGNEVDGVFTSTQDWEEFASLFKAASGTIFINYYRLVSSFHVLPLAVADLLKHCKHSISKNDSVRWIRDNPESRSRCWCGCMTATPLSLPITISITASQTHVLAGILAR